MTRGLEGELSKMRSASIMGRANQKPDLPSTIEFNEFAEPRRSHRRPYSMPLGIPYTLTVCKKVYGQTYKTLEKSRKRLFLIFT